MNERRIKNRPGTCFWNDDYLLIRDELTVEQTGRLFAAVMDFSLQICNRKQIDDDEVESIEPVIDTDDIKLQLYFRFLAAKVKRDELTYRETGRTNANNRQKGLEKQKGREKP